MTIVSITDGIEYSGDVILRERYSTHGLSMFIDMVGNSSIFLTPRNSLLILYWSVRSSMALHWSRRFLGDSSCLPSGTGTRKHLCIRIMSRSAYLNLMQLYLQIETLWYDRSVDSINF